MCHGVAEHIERYDPLASILAGNGFLVVGHDHVGHGKSEGIRVDIQDFNFYVRDVLQHIHMVKDEFPNIPLFLFGHSMGGAVAILTALEESALFSGVLLSAPMIKLDPEQTTPFKEFLLKIAACLFPQLHVMKLDSNDLSRDPDQVKLRQKDRLYEPTGVSIDKITGEGL
jgi:acylglycerol lipase